MQLNIGDKVASPYRRNLFFSTPYMGIVLSPTDPKAWIGTAAEPGLKTQKDINAHIAYCQANGFPDTTLPVLWNFDGNVRVFWDTRNSLVPYEAEVVEWFNARNWP